MNMLRRTMAAALALLLALVPMTACGKDSDDTPPALDPDNPSLISGEEKITADPFIYTQEDLTPYVTLGSYRDIEVTRGSGVMTDAQFEAQIQVMLEYYAEGKPITDRAAAEGDTVNFDYAGYIDGVQFEGGTATGQSITLTGNGGFIEGFVPAIIGKMPGAEFDIVTTFKCKLNYIEGEEKIVPELDDDFAKKYTPFQTAEELRADLRTKLEADYALMAESQVYNDVWAKIVENATIHKYPEDKVTYVYQAYVTDYGSYAAMSYSMTYEEYLEMLGMTDADVRELAREQVKDDLVFYALVKAENITVSDAEYEAGCPEFATSLNMSVEDMLEQYGEDAVRDGILWNKTQELVVSWAKVTEEK